MYLLIYYFLLKSLIINIQIIEYFNNCNKNTKQQRILIIIYLLFKLRKSYMLQSYAKSMVQLPVPDHQRAWTDRFCSFFGPVFFITIFSLSIGLRKGEYIRNLDYSLDSDGRMCGKDLPGFPFLYFPDRNDYTKQLCVAKCPRLGDQQIQCSPTKTLTCPDINTIVDTVSVDTEHGNYCLPRYKAFKDKVIQESGLVPLTNQRVALRIGQACIPLAICFGVLYLVLVQFWPKAIVWFSLFGAGASLFILSGLVLSDYSSIWDNRKALQILVGVTLLLLGFTMIAVIWVYRGQIALCNIFLRYAGDMLSMNPVLFVYIPFFISFTIAFMALSYFQHTSFFNFYPPQLQPAKNYYKSTPNYPLVILNIFAFFWGLNAIRDAFTFVISGNAVEWYFTRQPTIATLPVRRLLCKNFGSVFAGSYLNTLFLIPSMIFDALTCQQKIFTNFYDNGCHNSCCFSFLSFMNIARKDSYAYINLTGIQYCNAARECEQLCARSPLFPGSHSSLLPFRMAFHLSSLIPVIIITIFYLMRVGSGGNFQFYPVLLVTFLSFCLLTFFIDIHTDAAQGLQICYFIEEELWNANPVGNIWAGDSAMREEIRGAQLRYSRVGNISSV